MKKKTQKNNIFARELSFLRHKIHTGLFVAMFLSNISWIFTAVIQERLAVIKKEFNYDCQLLCYRRRSRTPRVHSASRLDVSGEEEYF